MPETLVVDCSVADKWILPEPDRDSALRLLARRNRREQLTAMLARRAYHLMRNCAPRIVDTQPRLSQALDLSLRHRMSLWDCVYLALAVEHACPLITADRRLFRDGRGRHPLLRLLQ